VVSDTVCMLRTADDRLHRRHTATALYSRTRNAHNVTRLAVAMHRAVSTATVRRRCRNYSVHHIIIIVYYANKAAYDTYI